MKELGQSLVKGAVLILGFVVLIIALSSLPGGQPGPSSPQDPAVQSQAQPSVAAPSSQRVPSAVRGATPAAPAPAPSPTATTTAPASAAAQPARSRLNRPQSTESDADMHRRISTFLERN